MGRFILQINGESGHQWRLILEQRLPFTHYIWPPESNANASETAPSRLQSLKQMGVEKWTALRQRFSESRSKDSHSDTASESSQSECSHAGPEPLPHLCDTFFAPQFARNRYLFSAFYKPTSLLTVSVTSNTAQSKIAFFRFTLLISNRHRFTFTSYNPSKHTYC